MSAEPGSMRGEYTFSPYLRCATTEPPLCAMPWTSLFLTSSPAFISADEVISLARRMPWPPTPQRRILPVFPIVLTGGRYRFELAERGALSAAVAEHRVD